MNAHLFQVLGDNKQDGSDDSSEAKSNNSRVVQREQRGRYKGTLAQ